MADTELQEPEVFDPAEHNVDAVLEHLAKADQAEAARVLEVEAQGKGRKGVLEWVPPEPEVPPTIEELLGDHDPYGLVRAKDQAGNEYTTTRVAALTSGSTVLEHKPALDQWGQHIPTKTVLDFRAEAEATDTTTPEEN